MSSIKWDPEGGRYNRAEVESIPICPDTCPRDLIGKVAATAVIIFSLGMIITAEVLDSKYKKNCPRIICAQNITTPCNMTLPAGCNPSLHRVSLGLEIPGIVILVAAAVVATYKYCFYTYRVTVTG